MRLIDADTMDFSRMKMPRGNALKAVIDFCDTQLTVSDINKWIPVTERLPEVYDTNTSEVVFITDGHWMAMGYITFENKWLFAECSNKGIDIDWTEITAWQPLPEPYRP